MKLFQKSSRALTGILAFSVFSFYSINSFGQFDTAPTYYDGVRDALIRNCAECHRDDAPNLGGISVGASNRSAFTRWHYAALGCSPPASRHF